VQGADSITAHNVGTGQGFPADLIGYDRTHDIALLQLRGAGGLPTAPLGKFRVRHDRGTGGLDRQREPRGPAHPRGGQHLESRQDDRRQGRADGQFGPADRLDRIAAPRPCGRLGLVPLVNGAGQVDSASITAATVNYRFAPGGKGFAIPINQASASPTRSASRVPVRHCARRAADSLLGVGVAAQRSGCDSARRRHLARRCAAARAAQAGLVEGDVLTSIDGQSLDSANTLTAVLDRHYPGDVLNLTWLDRSGQQRTGKATLTPGS
jgi:hypothetical protein